MSVSTGLNLAQQEAVNYLQGPSLVLAGAGSGKTRVITHKIARLIQTGRPAKKIAAITFTNKAALEMRERARHLVGKAAKEVVICTFHALGVRMLRESGEVLGLKPMFSILDVSDIQSQLKDIGATTDMAIVKAWQWQISQWKNEGLTAVQAADLAQNPDEVLAAKVMAQYEERLTAYQSVDFDDLMTLPLRLLQNHPEQRDFWQAQFAHLLVDEYQDTNRIQYELLRLLAGETAAFTAVGDDDQSIYGWRGATLDNLKRLPQDYPQLKVIKLEQNYRSTPQILQAANNVIVSNPKLFPKKLWSDLPAGEPVRVLDCDHEEHEAERAVARIQSLRSGQALSAGAGTGQALDFKHFAILYRANHQARVFEKALRKAQIPYKVSGGQSFFERAEIKDLCAWLRLWVNNDDDPAFLRAITTPKRGIGHQTLAQLGQFAKQYKVSLFEALFSHSLGTAMSARAVGSLHEFGRFLNDVAYRAKHCMGYESASEFLTQWLKDIEYEKYLYEQEDNSAIAQGKWSNVLDFCDWMAKRCGGVLEVEGGITTETPQKSLLEVAQTIALLSSISEQDKEQNVVTLSTLHAAKGLEWPHVILAGVNEGLLPFQNSSEQEAAAADAQTAARGGQAEPPPSEDFAKRIEEERRLMYVGITRAQHSLLVSWCKRRKKGRDTVPASPSRFIAEMRLDETTVKEDPREKLRALRAEFAARGQVNP